MRFDLLEVLSGRHNADAAIRSQSKQILVARDNQLSVRFGHCRVGDNPLRAKVTDATGGVLLSTKLGPTVPVNIGPTLE